MRHTTRGTLSQTGLLALAVGFSLAAFTPGAVAQESKPAKDAKLPPAPSLINDSIKAMGGHDAFKKIKYLSAVGTMSIPAMGMQAGMEMHTGPDGKFLMKQIMEGMGEMGGGSDGTIGWQSNPMVGGYMLVEGEELNQQRKTTGLHMLMINLEKNFKNLETSEETTFDDQPAYRIHASNDEGIEQDYYLPVGGGLPLAVEIDSPEGLIMLKFREWKDFDGAMLFTALDIEQGGMDIEMIFDTITINETDDAMFDPPAEVKKMMAEKEESADSTSDDN